MEDIRTGLRGDTEDIISKNVDDEAFIDSGNDSAADDGEDGGNDRRRPGRPIAAVFLTGLLSGAAVVLVLANALGAGRFITGSQWEYYKDLDSRLGKYYTIIKMIGEDPIARSTPEEINDERLKELVDSAGDPYAAYFTTEEYERYERQYSADYVGIGVGVAESEDGIIVMHVLEDGPAAEAGVRAEDIITKIDGIKPAGLDDAVSMLTGEAGTKVSVTVSRQGREITMEISRARLDQDSVIYNELEGYKNAGYIRITSFRHGTDDEFKLAVRDLRNKGCTKFIIDLRDNGGGLTDMSIKIADYLLPSCKIMTEVTKDGAEKVYNSGQSSAEIEYVVLVNERTASASEILAGAIQDNNGGSIIGSVTYGKGVTQVAHKFRDGSAVKMTVTEYFRPNGDKVNEVGITPDIRADDGDIMQKAAEELGLEASEGAK